MESSSVTTEEWRPIVGHPNYMISSMGRVKSLARTVACGPRGGSRLLPERMLRTPISPDTGYPHVVLDRITRNIHRLIALAFLGPPPTLNAHANHKNGIRAESVLSNLEWMTPSENAKHSFRCNGRIIHTKGKFSAEHGTSIPVIATCMKTGKETRYGAAMDAVRVGFRSDGISRACAGKCAHHAGFRWRYADGHTGRTWCAGHGIQLREPS